MREIEAKFLEIDREGIIEKLRSLGAKKSFEGGIEAIYFDTKKKSLRRDNLILRLRRRGDFSELTLKRKVSEGKAKVMEEKESKVDDFKEMRDILHGLGYFEIVKRRKHRITYRLGEIGFEIDKIDGIPHYLEIEAPSIDRIRHAAGLLGLDMKDSKPWPEGEVRRYYAKR